MRRGDISERDIPLQSQTNSLSSMNRGKTTAKTIETSNSQGQEGLFNATSSLPPFNRGSLATR